MAPSSKRSGRASRRPRAGSPNNLFTEEDVYDEVDAFHKEMDVIPLEDDTYSDESDDDIEQPVFDLKHDEEEDSGDESEDNEVNIDDSSQLTRFGAKIARQEKFLRQKFGGVEDEMHDDVDEQANDAKIVWGRRKSLFYGADNVDYEIGSSDEEDLALEEAEALRIQKEKAKSLRLEDFGLEDVNQDQNDSEQEAKPQGLSSVELINVKHKANGFVKDALDANAKLDINAMTKEEKMDILISTAPEVVGLLKELNDAHKLLENKVNPLMKKVKEEKLISTEGTRYLEMKQQLLLVYCQAITFYLLLKSEGQPVRDHPILANLVEINNLLKKMHLLDQNLPFTIDELLSQNNEAVIIGVADKSSNNESGGIHNNEHTSLLSETHDDVMISPKFENISLRENSAQKKTKNDSQADLLAPQSMEMINIRASLEENLKQKGSHSSSTRKPFWNQTNQLQTMNRWFETANDFEDEVADKEIPGKGLSCAGYTSSLSRLSQLVSAQADRVQVASGDHDLPLREDIGARRRRYELRVLARAGIQTADDTGDGGELCVKGKACFMDFEANSDQESKGSKDKFHRETERKPVDIFLAKSDANQGNALSLSLPVDCLEGKRHITYQMEKNRGLTRARKKLTKIPRKKYKLKHRKAVIRRKGQVREIRRPTGPYGGEATGININISRSIRFKS